MDPIKTAASGAPTWVTYTALGIAILGAVVAVATFVRGEVRWRVDRKVCRIQVVTAFVPAPIGTGPASLETVSRPTMQVVLSNVGEGRAIDIRIDWTEMSAGGVAQQRQWFVGVMPAHVAPGEGTQLLVTHVALWFRAQNRANPDVLDLQWRNSDGGRLVKRRGAVQLSEGSASVVLYRRWSFQVRSSLVRRLGGRIASSAVQADPPAHRPPAE